MSVNKAILLGNCGKNPDIKHLSSGDDLANLSIATSESWIDKRSGERQERTEWHRVVVFNPHLVKVIEKYVQKGTRIYIEGQVQTRKWSGQDGVERQSTEVVVPRYGGQLVILDRGASAGGQDRREAREPERTDQRGNPQYAGQGSDLDEEIPF